MAHKVLKVVKLAALVTALGFAGLFALYWFSTTPAERDALGRQGEVEQAGEARAVAEAASKSAPVTSSKVAEEEIYYAIDGEAPITSKDDPRYARFMAGRAANHAAEEEAEKRADPAGYAKRKADDARWAAGLAAGRSPDEMLAEMYAEAAPLSPLPAQRTKAKPGPVTMRQYERIATGMSPWEVWAVIDREACEEFAQSARQAVYTCKGTNDGVMSITFVDGDLVGKLQSGLK